jgi:hypothetical protein
VAVCAQLAKSVVSECFGFEGRRLVVFYVHHECVKDCLNEWETPTGGLVWDVLRAKIDSFIPSLIIGNVRIGLGSKANHLSYVGDSDVGAGVNIDAGTITCDYDGANKY